MKATLVPFKQVCVWCSKETKPGTQGRLHVDGSVNNCHLKTGLTERQIVEALFSVILTQ